MGLLVFFGLILLTNIAHLVVQSGHVRALSISCTIMLVAASALYALHLKTLASSLEALSSALICFLVPFLLLGVIYRKYPAFMAFVQGTGPHKSLVWLPVRAICGIVLVAALAILGAVGFAGALRWGVLNDNFFA
jgi:hypothetical protein